MEIKKNKITAVVGLNENINLDDDINMNDFLLGTSLIDYIKTKYNDEKRIDEGFKICLLDDSLKTRALNTLSTSEINKVIFLLKILSDKETIILTDFNMTFTEKELAYFKILFKRIANRYNHSLVLITNKIDNIMDIIDFILVIDGKSVVAELSSEDIYYDKIYQYIDTPGIIDFVKTARAKKHVKLDDYIDIKELIKGIYRGV